MAKRSAEKKFKDISAEARGEEAKTILKIINRGKARRYIPSITLLALLGLKPDSLWENAQHRSMGKAEIYDFMKDFYIDTYKRASCEREILKKLCKMLEERIIVKNSDDNKRSNPSPDTAYQIEVGFFNILKNHDKDEFKTSLEEWRKTMDDAMGFKPTTSRKTSFTIDGETYDISSGGQNDIIKSMLENFPSTAFKNTEMAYLGDTAGDKLNNKLLDELSINLKSHSIKPDMVLFDRLGKEIYVVEAVFTTGHIDTARFERLSEMFVDSKCKLIFVTAVKSRSYIKFPKVFKELAWGTSLWVADHPTGLIKFIEYDRQDS